MSNLERNGGVKSSEEEIFTLPKLEIDDQGNAFRSMCTSYNDKPIHDLLLEFLGRFMSDTFTDNKKEKNIKIKMPETIEEHLEVEWDDVGWSAKDLFRCFIKINSSDETGIDKISVHHQGFRKALANILKRTKKAGEMIIYVKENANIGGKEFTPGTYKMLLRGEKNSWNQFSGTRISEEKRETTILKVLLNENMKEKIGTKKNKITKTHLKRAFNKFYNKVNITFNGEQILKGPIIPKTVPDEKYDYRDITLEGELVSATIKTDFICAKQHGETNYLKISKVHYRGNLRNIIDLKKLEEDSYLNLQSETFGNLNKFREFNIFEKIEHEKDAKNYWILKKKHLKNIKPQGNKLTITLSCCGSKPIEKDHKIKNDIFKDWHEPAPHVGSGCLSDASIAGIILYTNNICIRTKPIRWKSTGEGTCGEHNWYCAGGTTRENKARGQKPKYLKCVPVIEINQSVSLSEHSNIYVNENQLKNETSIKSRYKTVFQALVIKMNKHFLYRVREGWVPNLEKNEINSKDDRIRYDKWAKKQILDMAEKKAKAEKKAREAEEKAKKQEIARKAEEIARKKAEAAMKEAEDKAKKEAEAKREVEEQLEIEAKKVSKMELKIKEQHREIEEKDITIENHEETIQKNDLEEISEEKKKKLMTCSVYVISDPDRPGKIKKGFTEKTKNELRKQYPPRYFPLGTKFHSFVTYKEMFKWRTHLEDRIHREYQSYVHGKADSEWIKCPENKNMEDFLEEIKTYIHEEAKRMGYDFEEKIQESASNAGKISC